MDNGYLNNQNINANEQENNIKKSKNKGKVLIIILAIIIIGLISYIIYDKLFINKNLNDDSNINNNSSENSNNNSESVKNIDNNDKTKFINIVKDCYVEEIVNNNNLGYNMIIEENGFNISGGQKHRIILSRALLSDFNILLVDEGLNQIDVNLERRILKNIFARYKDKTMIFISHRLENLDLYDHLIELDGGLIKKDEVKCKR
jgi:ABC-type bacteriocin/lantibiotic exporter with double-glycine peptidase domain